MAEKGRIKDGGGGLHNDGSRALTEADENDELEGRDCVISLNSRDLRGAMLWRADSLMKVVGRIGTALPRICEQYLVQQNYTSGGVC